MLAILMILAIMFSIAIATIPLDLILRKKYLSIDDPVFAKSASLEFIYIYNRPLKYSLLLVALTLIVLSSTGCQGSGLEQGYIILITYILAQIALVIHYLAKAFLPSKYILPLPNEKPDEKPEKKGKKDDNQS
jgi:hypothetical protein